MISVFRKGMKRWHSVLWVVFASMAVSGLSLVFWRSKHDDTIMATVNGCDITTKDYKKAVQQLQQRFAMFSSMYGVSLEVLMKTFMGGQDLQALALDNAVKATISSQLEKELALKIGPDFFNAELVKALPQGFTDAQGRVNREMYENYLQRRSMTPAEFEQSCEDEFKREALDYVVGAAAYAPQFVADFQATQEGARKSFAVVHFDQASFKEKAGNISAEDLKRFYDDHKERYRTPERKQARTAVISSANYNGIAVDEQSVLSFYEKNKATKYRVAPKVRVRHIFLAGHDATVKAKAESLLALVKKDVGSFASIAKQQSQADDASNGGLTAHFNRAGKFDTAFEKEAFKLMKTGDLSPLVRTEKGFEIIMLEDRISASEKPLREVRDEITSALHSRKVGNAMKSDLEGLMHAMKSNPQAFDEFVAKKSLKAITSDLLTAQDRKEDGFDGKLAEHLFGRAASRAVGYFMYKDDFVLYQVVATEKSTVPALAQVEKKVLADCATQKSTDELKHFVKAAKSAVLDGKRDLASYKAEGFSVSSTGALRKDDSFKDIKGLVARAFLLDDPAQILEFKAHGDLYLIQLENAELDAHNKTTHVNKAPKSQDGRALAHGFIASLQRNAKITVNETLMNANKSL